MKDENISAEFTSALRDFLDKRGYSHIVSLGIEPKEINDAIEPETERENYWLEPIKPEDERLSNAADTITIHDIKDDKIFEMVAGKDETQFMIKVPLVDYNDYLVRR